MLTHPHHAPTRYPLQHHPRRRRRRIQRQKRRSKSPPPPDYTDTSLVRTPIKVSEYIIPSPQSPLIANERDGETTKEKEEETWDFEKGVWEGGCGPGGVGGMEGCADDEGEYLRYWVKGGDGRFLERVVEPPGGSG
jgi:hypothetical protein